MFVKHSTSNLTAVVHQMTDTYSPPYLTLSSHHRHYLVPSVVAQETSLVSQWGNFPNSPSCPVVHKAWKEMWKE